MRRIRLRYVASEDEKSAHPDLYDADTGESLALPIRRITLKDGMYDAPMATVEILLDLAAPVAPEPNA